MKRIILASCLTLLAGSSAFSQAVNTVGVGTDNPKGPLHIDAKKDTSSDGTTNTADDVIVDSNGNLGVGTVTPADKVHIQTSTAGTGLRLNDGSQGQGNMLMSKDAVGTGVWTPKPFYTQEGALATSGRVSASPGGNNYNITTTPLFLAPGSWLIMAKYSVVGNSGGFYFWTYLHDLDDMDPAVTPNRRSPGLDTNPNWYLNKSTSFQRALSVAGIYPEQVGGFITTPTLSYVAVIKNTFNKTPGQDGYLHELRLTFSTSATGAIDLQQVYNGFDLGAPFFFAIRLDVDPTQL